jgi:hypothetical protein
VYAEAFVPRLHVASGVALVGGFSHLVSFACSEGNSLGLPDVAREMCAVVEKALIGFTLVGECEDRIVLAGGVMGTTGEAQWADWLKPQRATGGADLSGHVHAAMFPYHPLRLGFVKLKDTIVGLFENDLLDVIHVGSADDAAQPQPLRLLRGVAWFSPIG